MPGCMRPATSRRYHGYWRKSDCWFATSVIGSTWRLCAFGCSPEFSNLNYTTVKIKEHFNSMRSGDSVMAWIKSRPTATEERTGKAHDRPAKSSAASDSWFLALKRELHQQVISAMDLSSIGTMADEQLRLEVR